MVKAAAVPGPVWKTSGRRWTIGKGLVGRTALLSREWEVIQHDTFWPPNLDVMSRREWRQAVEAEIREGRSLRDAQAVKSLYGTAVAAPIRPWVTEELMAVGCVTVHTAAGDTLSQAEVDECAKHVIACAAVIAEHVSTVDPTR